MKDSLIILLSLLLSVGHSSVEEENRIIKELFDTSKYDAGVRPSSEDGPTEVKVNMFIRNIDSVDIKNQDFTVDITFRQEWVDRRLAYDSSDVKYLTLPSDTMVWTPDTFFRNAKEGAFHLAPSKQFYVRVFPDGSVLYSLRLKLKLQCWMNLKRFPFDSQECKIQIASYSYTSSTLYYSWKEPSPLQIASALSLPNNMRLNEFDTSHCDVLTSTGRYSCVSVDLNMMRNSSLPVLTVYIPYTMLLCVVYTVFWLKQGESLLRIGITLVMLLTATAKQETINQELPPMAYTKSIDVWTGVCTFFIFCAFIVCVVVHYLQRDDQEVISDTEKSRVDRIKGAPVALKIDFTARMIYPLGFVIFNIIYWSTL